MISEKGGHELGYLALYTLMVNALPITPLKLRRLNVLFVPLCE